MEIAELMQRREALQRELSELEREAGIAASAGEKAWDLAFIPYGALGDEIREFTPAQNAKLYFDNEHDDKARRVRKLYFSVQDLSARRNLIAKVLELDDLHDRAIRDDAENAKRAFAEAERNQDNLPWATGAFIGVVCVLVGYWIGKTIGAIAGAVAGIFVGMGAVSNARRDRRSAVVQATADLESSEESLHETLTRPRFFTAGEAATGTEDNSYHVDAFGARIREFRR